MRPDLVVKAVHDWWLVIAGYHNGSSNNLCTPGRASVAADSLPHTHSPRICRVLDRTGRRTLDENPRMLCGEPSGPCR